MVRICYLISGEQALSYLQVIKAAVVPADRIEPVYCAALRLFDGRQAENTKPLGRRVAGLNLHPVGDAAERVGTAFQSEENAIVWISVGIRAGFQSRSSGKTAARMVSRSVFVKGRAGWNTAVSFTP